MGMDIWFTLEYRQNVMLLDGALEAHVLYWFYADLSGIFYDEICALC